MANIEQVQYLNAPVATVYEALTTSKGLAAVWTTDLNVEAEQGAINEFRFGQESPTKMEIIELIQDQRVVWKCIDSDPEWVGTEIAFDLEQKNGKTSLILRHMHWREVTEFYRWCNYNWAMFLYSLKQYCEKGEGMPYQSRF